MDIQTYLQLRKKVLTLRPKVRESFVKVNLNEDILSQLWYRQSFDRRNLQTIKGEKLTVLSAGEKSIEPFSDFTNAKIIVNDVVYTGDVEIHLNRSDWFKHKHSSKKSANIILHVFYNYDTKKEIKDVKFELCLKEKINVDSINAYTTITETEGLLFGETLCGKALLPKDYDYLEQLVISAAEARLWLKSEEFFRWFIFEHIEEQTLYEEIAEVYGYLNNRDNFLTLARFVPVGKLRKVVKSIPGFKVVEIIESIYFGVAGFLDSTSQDVRNEYVERLSYIWSLVQHQFRKRMKPDQWRYYKTRPVNFPQRRIAALSRTISHFIEFNIHKMLIKFFKNFNEEEVIKHIINIFYQPADGFFANHCSFVSKTFPKEYPLFGEEKVGVIIVNTILPYFLYYARKSKDEKLIDKVFSVYKNLRIVEKNNLVENFVSNIIQYQQYRKYFLSRAMFIQGFIQLYKDFCQPVHQRCENCYLVRILKEKIENVNKTGEVDFIEL